MAENTDVSLAVEDAVDNVEIRNLIYAIRGKQVMLDSDLAMLYQVETSALNRSMKRNRDRFPEDFCFQLTQEEYESLRCQFGISKENSGKGGRRYLPFVYAESGIAMLSSILRSDIAVQVSVRIMKTFVEMRRFFSNNQVLFERISAVELQQLEYQKQTDEKFEQVFDYIADHEECRQKVFFDGQIYDAFSLIASLIQKAHKNIILIDGYVNVDTLNLLAKKNLGVDVTIYTKRQTKLSETDVANFNAQYSSLNVEYTEKFHDRFLILDEAKVYHIGASIKDAGRKCFGITLIQDETLVREILLRLNS